MQPSGRAVTTHPSSLYSSARHILPSSSACASASNHTWSPSNPIVFAEKSAGRDLTWKNGGQIVFSRNASSRATPPPPPPTKRKTEYRPPPRLQYRPQASRFRRGDPAQIADPNDLDSLDFSSMFGTPSQPPAKANDAPTARPATPSQPTQTVSVPSSVRSTSQAAEESATATSLAAEEAAAAEESASNELAASEAAVDRQSAAVQASVLSNPKELVTTSEGRPMHSPVQQEAATTSEQTDMLSPLQQDRIIGPLSASDEIKHLGQVLAALEKRNLELAKSHAEARKSLQDMANQESELRSEVDSIEAALESEISNAQARERGLKKSHQHLKNATDAKIGLLEKDLAFERSPRRQQEKRLESMQNSAARNAEAARQMREKEERLATRKDYYTFREFFVNATKAIQSMAGYTGRIEAELDFLRRRTAYWTRSLEAFKSFDSRAKDTQEVRETALKKENISSKQAGLRLGELMGQIEHQDEIHKQVAHYIHTNITRLEQATMEYGIRSRQIFNSFEQWKVKSHALRKTLRLVRFDMDTSRVSPLMGARERSSTIATLQIERPATYLVLDLREQISQLNLLKSSGENIELIPHKVNALQRAKSELRMVKAHGMLHTKLSRAEWIANQPIWQKDFWQKTAPLAYWHAELTTRTDIIDRDFRRAGISRDNPIWQNLKGMFDLRRQSAGVDVSAFKLALLKSERGLYDEAETEEIEAAVQRNISNAVLKIREFNKLTSDVHRSNQIFVAQQSNRRTLDTAETIQNMTKRQKRRKALKVNPSVKPPVDVSSVATSGIEEGGPTKKDKTSSASSTSGNDDHRPIQDSASTSLKVDNAESVNTAKSIPDASQPLDSTSDPESSAQVVPGVSQLLEKTPNLKDSTQVPKLLPSFRKDGSRVSASERRHHAPHGASVRPRGRVLPKPSFKPRSSFKLALRPTGRKDQENMQRPADFVERSQSFGDGGSVISHNAQPKVPPTELATNIPNTEIEDSFGPLLYQIPPKDLRTALMASSSTQASSWSYSLYKSPEGKNPTRHYCRKFDQAERTAQLFTKENVIGFDIEWEMGSKVGQGNIKDNVSLIQIACDDRIALFQIASFYGDTAEVLMPPTLKSILESPNIIKAGVNIAGDFTRLRKCLGVEGQGIFELSHLYKLIKYSEREPTKVNKSPAKLADQVQDILFLPLLKGPVRTSSWSKALSGEQIDYACSDAYAGFRLFHALESARRAMVPMPPRPAFWESDMPIRLGNGEIADDARKRNKAMARKAAQQPDPSSVTPEEEQALDEEEEEAEAQAEAENETVQGSASTGFFENEIPAERLSGQLAASSSFEKAEAWMQQWEDSLPTERKSKSLPSSIRAYALWHHQGLELGQVAEAMRQPPLALSTVASYVLEVVRSENLPSEMERLRQALDFVPAIARWKYRGLVQQRNKTEN